MQLSKRLSAVAEFVTPGGCLVDVGTDHGYVPIALLEQKKILRRSVTVAFSFVKNIKTTGSRILVLPFVHLILMLWK